MDRSVGFLVGGEAGAAGHLEGALLARLATTGLAELAEAYSAIKNPKQRAALMQLAKSMADDQQASDD